MDKELKGKISGPVISAIEMFMRFGNETTGLAHNGYYGERGWPYEILKRFLSDVKTEEPCQK
jgi:hypothetical protein